jgi:tungstate transport system substrate-binding protein
VKSEAVQQLVDFLLSEESQQVIAEFGVEKFGEPLFFSRHRQS